MKERILRKLPERVSKRHSLLVGNFPKFPSWLCPHPDSQTQHLSQSGVDRNLYRSKHRLLELDGLRGERLAHLISFDFPKEESQAMNGTTFSRGGEEIEKQKVKATRAIMQ